MPHMCLIHFCRIHFFILLYSNNNTVSLGYDEVHESQAHHPWLRNDITNQSDSIAALTFTRRTIASQNLASVVTNRCLTCGASRMLTSATTRP